MLSANNNARTSAHKWLRCTAAAFAFCALLPAARAQNPTPPLLDAALQTATPGMIVDLHGASAYQYINQNPNQLGFTPGTLIYSDDPETVRDHGVLYRTPVPAGDTRVYGYHVNGMTAASKFTTVLQNAGTGEAVISFARKSLPTPSGNYFNVGKQAALQYYENINVPPPITLLPGAAAVMDPALDALSLSNNQLVSAQYDFASDQPLTVTTLMLPAAANTLATFATAPLSTGDTHNRQGTFPNWGKHNATAYNYTTTQHVRSLRLGDGQNWTDSYVTGTDHERGVATTLRGNFGVTYKINIWVNGTDGRRLAVLLNPRGGGYAGYMVTTYNGVRQGQLHPSTALNVALQSQATVCALLQPAAAPQLLTIEWMPPGASNMPVEILLVPYSGAASVDDWALHR